MSYSQYKVAVIQASPEFMNIDAGIDKAIRYIREASENGARLIAFPEIWLPGYPWWIWLGSPAWGFQFVAKYHENSLSIDSPQFERIFSAAKEYNINVVIGFSEKDNGTLYLSQAIISDQGELLSKRRKLKPTHVERSLFGEGDGSDLQVVDSSIGKLGALCCAEHIQPLTKYAMYSMHEQIHVASWPSFTIYRGIAYGLGHEVNKAASQVYALEGGCYVLHACAITGKDAYDLLCTDEEKLKLLNPAGAIPGGGFSMIFGPDGSPLCEPLPEDQEGLLYADIDLAMISIAKSAYDPVGHYSRGDVLRLMINRNKRIPSMTFTDAQTLITIDGSGLDLE